MTVSPDGSECPSAENVSSSSCRFLRRSSASPFSRYWSAQPGWAAFLVGVGLGHPVPQALFADAGVLGDSDDRFAALAGHLDRALPELRGMWCGHVDILPGGMGHLGSGVRAKGASSLSVSRKQQLHLADVLVAAGGSEPVEGSGLASPKQQQTSGRIGMDSCAAFCWDDREPNGPLTHGYL